MIVSTKYMESLLRMPWREVERIAANAGSFYRAFDCRRERGAGKWRHIDNPKDALKAIQSRIYKCILLPVPMPDTITGGVRGRSVRDHAEPHVGHPVLVTLDLRSCFPRISHKAINRVYRRLGYSPTIARVLTQLTTLHQALPQGAPTSPALANLALLDLHEELKRLAQSRGLTLTQYVDDIAISGADAQAVIEPAILTIMRHGHSVARRKVVVAHAGTQQKVTGTVVNVVRSIDRKYRQALYHRIHELACSENLIEAEIRSVRSAIAHVESTNLTQGAVLRSLADRILPEVGVEGRKPRTDEFRPCRHRRRHREQRHLASSECAAC
jgi:RNA-directed DNA polymerase